MASVATLRSGHVADLSVTDRFTHDDGTHGVCTCSDAGVMVVLSSTMSLARVPTYAVPNAAAIAAILLAQEAVACPRREPVLTEEGVWSQEASLISLGRREGCSVCPASRWEFSDATSLWRAVPNAKGRACRGVRQPASTLPPCASEIEDWLA